MNALFELFTQHNIEIEIHGDKVRYRERDGADVPNAVHEAIRENKPKVIELYKSEWHVCKEGRVFVKYGYVQDDWCQLCAECERKQQLEVRHRVRERQEQERKKRETPK